VASFRAAWEKADGYPELILRTLRRMRMRRRGDSALLLNKRQTE